MALTYDSLNSARDAPHAVPAAHFYEGSRGLASQLESEAMRPVYQWNLGSRTLELGKRTLVMGVVNVTPDSFSDGGQFLDPERAVEHALALLDQGADIVDVGGESTRPGSQVLVKTGSDKDGRHSSDLFTANSKGRKAVSEQEELDRVIPVIIGVKRARGDAIVSVDTYKAGVAGAAVAAGA